jgi:hypothetical protein
LQSARSTDAWSESLQTQIAAVTGDDAAMSLLGVGADFGEFQALFAPRVAELGQQFIVPLDELSNAVVQAEHELELLRRRELDEAAKAWDRYKPDYELYFRPQALAEGNEDDGTDGLSSGEPAGLTVVAQETDIVQESPPEPSRDEEASP